MNRKLLGIFSPDMPPEEIADAIMQSLDEVLADAPPSDETDGADTHSTRDGATSPRSGPQEEGA